MSQNVGSTALAMARTWHHVSAKNAILGKLAVDVAELLMGKRKPVYDQAMDVGDYVVITNSRHVAVTGKKAHQKLYRHHTMYPGGLKEIKYEDMMEKKPDEVSFRSLFCYSNQLKWINLKLTHTMLLLLSI